MKKLVFISGLLTFYLSAFGVLFKIFHWYGSDVLMALGIVIFSVVFVPSFAKYLYDKN